MCIIAYAQPNIKFNIEELRNCFENNSDGAGVMYKSEEGIKVKKGFFEFGPLVDYIKTLPLDTERVIHFRFATDGEINKQNCHPFAIGKETATEVTCDWAFAHNGVLTDYRTDIKAKHSDTMELSYKLLSKYHGTLPATVITYLQNTGSRFIFLSAQASTVNIGVTHKSEESGVLYSNDGYSYSYSKYYEYGVDEEWDAPIDIAHNIQAYTLDEIDFYDLFLDGLGLSEDEFYTMTLEEAVDLYNVTMEDNGVFDKIEYIRGSYIRVYDEVGAIV